MIDWIIEKMGVLGAAVVVFIAIFLLVNLIGGVFE